MAKTATISARIDPDLKRIKRNWLLIYRLVDDQLILVRIGSHADLF